MTMQVKIQAKVVIVHSKDSFKLMMLLCKKELQANRFVSQTLCNRLKEANEGQKV